MSDNGRMAAAAPAERLAIDPEPVAALDPLVVNPGRLSILLALSAGGAGVEFVDLRRRTRLTDGNLACHARRLADGGMIDIDKRFRGGKPVTTYLLTDGGRQAVQTHVRELVSAVPVTPPWARAEPSTRVASRSEPDAATGVEVAGQSDDVDDDWVD